MRLAYVTAAAVPSYAANGVQSFRMCEAFGGAVDHVDLICLAPSADLADVDPFAFYGAEPTFSIQTLSRRNRQLGRGLATALAAVRTARKQHADLVYTRHLLSALIAARSGLPTVLELHAMSSVASPLRRRWFQQLLASPNLRLVVVISDALRQALTDAFPRVSEVTVVAHDAAAPVNTDLAPLELRSAAEPVADRNDSDGVLVVGYVGGLYPGKGLELLLALAERLPWASFHIAGRVEGGLATTAGQLAPNVKLHGFLRPADGDRFRLGCDVLVAPYGSRVAPHGGTGDIAPWMSPLKLFEYMAAGRPIVVADLPVLREVLTDGETALFAPPDDLPAWEASLGRLRDDAALRTRLGAAANREFHAHYTYAARARRLLSHLT